MYRMFISERLLNDINEILKFTHVKLNKTRKLFML